MANNVGNCTLDMFSRISLSFIFEFFQSMALFRAMARSRTAMATTPQAQATPRLYYGWIIVGLGFVTLAFQVVYRFSFAIFSVPFVQEFGWSRGLLGSAFSLALFVYAVSSPYVGSLLERKGPRAIMPWGCFLVAAASLAGFFINSIWHIFFLFGIVGGIGLALNGFATNTAIMPRWFVQKRGRATGITLSGIGIGILVLSPMIERMIDMWGWRLAYVAYGAIVLFIITPASYLIMRDRPEDVGQARDGLPARQETDNAVVDTAEKATVDKSVRSVFLTLKGDYRFWAMMFLYFAIGFNNNTIISQIQLYFVDVGFSMTAAALVLGAVGFLRTIGSVSGGWLGDRIGRGRGTAVSAILVNLGMILLLLIPFLGGGLFPAFAFVVIYGLGIGGMSACGSAMGGDIFEGPTYGVIVGFTEICYGLGGVVGPPLAGFFFDYTKSYVVPFSLIIFFIFISIVAALVLQKSLVQQPEKSPA